MKERTRLTHVVLPDARGELRIVTAHVPEESAAENVRNAVFLLRLIATQAPATFLTAPDLAHATAHARDALVILEEVPSQWRDAARHIEDAGRHILLADLDWNVLTAVRGAMARLCRALFQVNAAGAA